MILSSEATLCIVYNYLSPSICQVKGETQFSQPLMKMEVYFFLCISLLPMSNEHIFFKYFVRRSFGQATKGRNVKI